MSKQSDYCDWFVGETGYSETGCGASGWLDPIEYKNFRFCPFCGEETGYPETGCGASGWLDPIEYKNFRFCPFCGEEIRVIQEDEDDDE